MSDLISALLAEIGRKLIPEVSRPPVLSGEEFEVQSNLYVDRLFWMTFRDGEIPPTPEELSWCKPDEQLIGKALLLRSSLDDDRRRPHVAEGIRCALAGIRAVFGKVPGQEEVLAWLKKNDYSDFIVNAVICRLFDEGGSTNE